MTNSDPQTHFHYRLLDAHGEVLDEAEWPTDGEAVLWAERHRGADDVPTFRRIERLNGDTWVYVSEAGVTEADRGSEDL